MERHNKKGKPKGKALAPGKRRWYKSKGFKWTIGILAFLIIAVVGFYTYYIGHFLNKIQTPKDGTQAVTSADAWSGTDPVNIVLFGVDNRNHDPHPRSDSIIVVHIDPVAKKAKIISVMRDTWYNIPNYGYEKINAAMAFGGPDLAIQTLKQFLGIPINYYVKTDFQGFIGIVDALGGVDINVEKPLHYADDGTYDINLNAGLQHLDGKHALMYVRFRHDAMSDFARTERQRTFLQAVAKQMAQPSSLVKLPSILDAAAPYIETNIPAGDMLKLAMLARSVDTSDIQSMQAPSMDALKEGTAGGGQSVLFPDTQKTREEVYKFLGLDPSTLPTDNSDQPPEYNDPNPVAPQNPNVDSSGNIISTQPVSPAPSQTAPTTPDSGKSTGGSNPFGNSSSGSGSSGSSSDAGKGSSSGNSGSTTPPSTPPASAPAPKPAPTPTPAPTPAPTPTKPSSGGSGTGSSKPSTGGSTSQGRSGSSSGNTGSHSGSGSSTPPSSENSGGGSTTTPPKTP